ncbi:MAG: MBL fold metallo-hydrolase [Candidatus Aminicenantes bacterium]|nr:MBL fold metallo-hydrolase [Candidatus Aminicenantes bacterium]
MIKNKLCLIFTILAIVFLLSESLNGKVEIRITILYDNYVTPVTGVQADWGFSCLVQGTEKTILFDTGTRSDILQKNIESLKVDLSRINMIVISHLHGDHIGGLQWILSQKRDIPVYLPAMAKDDYLAKVRQWGGLPLRISKARQVCRNVFSTGEMPADFDPAFSEQSLVIKTSHGLLVITGCAHPGILEIVRRAHQVVSGQPRVVLGGFHLMRKDDREIAAIIDAMKTAGVERCGASHCTGDRAIEFFRNAFTGRFLPLGVGTVLTFPR